MAVASCQVNVEFWPAGVLDMLGSHPDQDTPVTISQLLHSSVSSQWVLSDLLDYQACFRLVPAPGCGWKAVLLPLETPTGPTAPGPRAEPISGSRSLSALMSEVPSLREFLLVFVKSDSYYLVLYLGNVRK